jgi:hypothetical protein
MESFIWLGFWREWEVIVSCTQLRVVRINNRNAAANTVFSYNDFDIKIETKKTDSV